MVPGAVFVSLEPACQVLLPIQFSDPMNVCWQRYDTIFNVATITSTEKVKIDCRTVVSRTTAVHIKATSSVNGTNRERMPCSIPWRGSGSHEPALQVVKIQNVSKSVDNDLWLPLWPQCSNAMSYKQSTIGKPSYEAFERYKEGAGSSCRDRLKIRQRFSLMKIKFNLSQKLFLRNQLMKPGALCMVFDRARWAFTANQVSML